MRGWLDPAAREVAVVNGLTYILVVEDDHATCELVESVLTHGRYDAVSARSPSEALRASQALEVGLQHDGYGYAGSATTAGSRTVNVEP